MSRSFISDIVCMLNKGLYASLMSPACDVTAWVREGQHYPRPGKAPP